MRTAITTSTAITTPPIHVTAHQQESIFSLPQGQTETGSIEQVTIQPDGSIHGQQLSQGQVQ